jgi:hypothetical protein
MDLIYIEWEGVEWIQMAQDSVQWRAVGSYRMQEIS